MAFADIRTELLSPELLFPLGLTLRVCLLCLILHALTAIPLAWWAQRPGAPFRRVVSFLVTLPLVFPPIALGFLLLLVFGYNGPGGWLLRETAGIRLVFTTAGVTLAAYLAGLPLVVKPVQAALGNPELIRLRQAARVCGAGPVTSFFLITLPLIRHSLAAGLLLGLTRALGEVGMTLMLGGNISGRTNTLSLEIFNAVSAGEFDRAVVLCGLLACLSLLLYAAIAWCQRRED